MIWNFNIADAPHDTELLLASKCKKVVKAKWSETRQHWPGFADNEQPVAWMLYPLHPYIEMGI